MPRPDSQLGKVDRTLGVIRWPRSENVGVDSIRNQPRTIGGLVALEVHGVGADETVATEVTELSTARLARPVAVLGDINVSRPVLAPASRPLEVPVDPRVAAANHHVEVRGSVETAPRKIHGVGEFLIIALAAESRQARPAFEPLARSTGDDVSRHIRHALIARSEEDRSDVRSSGELLRDFQKRRFGTPTYTAHAGENHRDTDWSRFLSLGIIALTLGIDHGGHRRLRRHHEAPPAISHSHFSAGKTSILDATALIRPSV